VKEATLGEKTREGIFCRIRKPATVFLNEAHRRKRALEGAYS